MKHVVIFGLSKSGPEAARNTVLCRVFSKIFLKTSHCTINFGFARPDAKPGAKIIHALIKAPLRWFWLGLKYLSIPDHDLVFVPYPSHSDAWLAMLLAGLRKKPVVLDAFYGIYDTAVRDRKIFKKSSLPARLIWKYENRLLKAADAILVDTTNNGAMFQKDFNIDSRRITAVPVGVDETLWTPVDAPENDRFQVVFWSTFIPLHGAATVARAAKQLEQKQPEIQFVVIGNGQLGEAFKTLLEKLKLKNLKWINRFIPLSEIRKYVEAADCCLGVFGKTDKTQRVIPYKAYQALASARPLITGQTKASTALFNHGVNALLVRLEDPQELSDAILKLAKNRKQVIDMGKNGWKLYQRMLSNAVIEAKLKEVVKNLDRKNSHTAKFQGE